MDAWLFYCLLAAPLPIGMASVMHDLARNRRIHHDVVDFLNDLVRWCNESGKSDELYEHLVRRSGVIQSHLGAYGRGFYRPPFQGFGIHNYPIVVNCLPELRDGYRRLAAHSFAPNMPETIDAIDGCLRRHVGHLDEEFAVSKRTFAQPIGLYVRGVRAVVGVPFAILAASGMVTETSETAGWLLRFLTAIGTLVLTAIAVVKGLRDLGLL